MSSQYGRQGGGAAGVTARLCEAAHPVRCQKDENVTSFGRRCRTTRRRWPTSCRSSRLGGPWREVPPPRPPPPPPPYPCPYPCPYCTLTPLGGAVAGGAPAPRALATRPPYCCPYPCPYCTLIPCRAPAPERRGRAQEAREGRGARLALRRARPCAALAEGGVYVLRSSMHSQQPTTVTLPPLVLSGHAASLTQH